ncbi:MAG: tRNA 2-thiouridine(34) synthase MnmA [Nitriliruptorales bacterium]|nr:tRNA 2-thiouridine(34) synthase MnmA [Nitriliruptorales bacterium]
MANVLVALSGGVDSAVAAALLADAGHDVTGVHLKLADVPLAEQVPGQGCCTLDDAQDARRAAQVLGIDFYVWDMADLFREEVLEPFVDAYVAGQTPNPCVTCNEKVKYTALHERAMALGFDALATGHHARIGTRDGTTALLRGRDQAKDQSYVLWMATAEQLATTMLPIGEHPKEAVRALAAARGLRMAAKPDSYDVCFIPSGDTAGWLRERVPAAPGPVVDLDGRQVGEHDGVWQFTIGQRRGLGLGSHERRFVVDLDAASATVVVGAREQLACRWAELDRPNWISTRPTGDRQLTAQVRAHGRPVPARVDGNVVHFDEPVIGVARGQSVVLYDGDVCLGGGRVKSADRPMLTISA